MTNFEHYKDRLIGWCKMGCHCDRCLAKSHCDTNNDSVNCVGEIIEWGAEEYIPSKLKLHTMQEISDFFGRNLSKDENGEVFMAACLPVIKGEEWQDGTFLCKIPRSLICDIDAHPWRTIITPSESNE